MSTPTDRLYSESHEWFQVEGDTVTIGITQYAANELTDITYVEIQPTGTGIEPGDSLGEVESVKTTSDINNPWGGTIVAVNEGASGNPALLNSDPYGEGWLVKIQVDDATPPGSLMNQATYDERYPLG